jgi:hypothetical protein
MSWLSDAPILDEQSSDCSQGPYRRDDWNGGNSLNRVTGGNLAIKLKNRLRQRLDGKVPRAGVDVLVTGCEAGAYTRPLFSSIWAFCHRLVSSL